MMKPLFLLGLGLSVVGSAARAGAQQPPRAVRDSVKTIPSDARPPKGMCRIWIDNVPASQQPAPTDCASAVKNRPTNGRVIFGDDYGVPKKEAAKTVPAGKGFTEVKPDVKRPPIKPPGE
jgi:hypothetical protein